MEFCLLEDEKFDFDLPLSPQEERNDEADDDEEIFFGPIGHKERCIATNTETKATKILDDIEKSQPLSSPNPEQVVEIFKEATTMALMLKSCSSEVNSDSEDRDRNNNLPELINDIKNKKLRVSRDDQDENVSETKETEKSTDKAVIDNEESRDGFVVRRRTLRERNHGGSNIETSKIQRLMQKSNAPSHKSPLKISKQFASTKAPISPCSPKQSLKDSRRKTIAVTPSKNSFSSSKTERNKSSSASDTSFSEENKQSKLPTNSHYGLKPPGFSSSRRRRSSSNSSVSSTSSTSSIPGFSLNETFTVPKQSEAQPKKSNIKQPSSTKSKPSTKGILTKMLTSKPVFAKPNEVHKASKLQAMKAVQTAAGPRSFSSSGLKSPALYIKNNTRSVSAGTTPLSSQTPKVDRTQAKGSTPVCRRSSIVSASTAVKPRLNNLVTGSEVSGKAATPLQRRSICHIPSIGKGKFNSASGVVARRPNSAMKGSLKSQGEKNMITIQPTPENKTIQTKIIPDKTAETPEHKMKPPSSANRRRSLLPTPNMNKKAESKRSQSSSPVPFNLSPKASATTKKSKSAVKKLELNKPSENPAACSNTDNISPDNLTEKHLPTSPEINPVTFILDEKRVDTVSAGVDDGPDGTRVGVDDGPDLNKIQTSPGNLSPGNSTEKPLPTLPDVKSVTVDEKSFLDVIGIGPDDGPDLMIQSSPVAENVLVDVSADPFSPGIDSPDLPIDGCLNPIVLTMASKDLIDLSCVSPKQEVDLIDLAAKSPLVEAKLVDI